MSSHRSLPQSSQPTRFGRGTLSLARRGQILIVALDRLQLKNAFNDDVYLDLVDVLHMVEQEDSVVAIVLTGTGSYFSSGADLKALKKNPGAMGNQTLERPTGKFMMALIGFPKIIAVAVNGPAVGIGVTLLLHCDLVICAERASFWAPFTRLALGMYSYSYRTKHYIIWVTKSSENIEVCERSSLVSILLLSIFSSRTLFVRNLSRNHGLCQSQ
jgi:enoyl-CoA hydratase/carnithine racemase